MAFFAFAHKMLSVLDRDLERPILEDLQNKMVFLAGPRQVGKTTLARRLLDRAETSVYLNWDRREDRREIQAARWPGGEALVVLDELHKWRGWKRWIKGEYDQHHPRLRFLVTGSAHLDVYRRGGDSLQGRYHHHRLHPLTCAEINHRVSQPLAPPGQELEIPASTGDETLATLLRFSGFPEPYTAGSDRTHRRWQKERLDRFFREDVRDLESIRDLSLLQELADRLPERVAAPLSINALREDLEVSHRALTRWMEILDRLYYSYRIRPFASSRARTLRKMPKAYLWDWTLVASAGPRFENLVASHLLKLCHRLVDQEGFQVELHYIRDREGREVDFLVTYQGAPWFAVEAKTSQTRIDPNLLHFKERLGIPHAYQVVLNGERDFIEKGVRCLPAARFLDALA